MQKQNRIRLDIPIHPIFWGLYPFASLYLANIAEVPIRAILPSAAFAVTITILLPIVVLSAISFWSAGRKQNHLPRAFGVVVLFIALYLPLYQVVENASAPGTLIGRHRYLLPLWGMLCIATLIYFLSPAALMRQITNRGIWERAALASSVALILFFSYGHAINIVMDSDGAQAPSVNHWIFLIVWVAFFVTANMLIEKVQNKTYLTQAANLIGGFLLASVLIQIGIWMMRDASKPQAVIQSFTPSQQPSSPDSPDVYYIVLDGYSRSDRLSEEFGVDNSEFIAKLRAMGFVIPECAQSNYPLTILSMTSSLNMDYLTAFPPGLDENSAFLDFEPYLHQSRVLNFFESRGYETFTFAGINPYTEIPNSTHFIASDSSAERSADIAALNFQYLFLQTTALRPLLDYLESPASRDAAFTPTLRELIPSDIDLLNRRYFRYQQNLYHLKVLEGIPDLPGRKFVYTHLYMAHEPFVFTPEGEFLASPEDDRDAYADQIRFLDNRIPQIVQKIIAGSSVPPVIVIQADHGWGWNKRRDQILNAYYLPDGGNELVYPEITPVNTFRLIINKYFGGNYEFLPDVSYSATYGDFRTKSLSIAPPSCIPR